MSHYTDVIPADLRARFEQLQRERSAAMGSWDELAEIEDTIAAVCDELADALFQHDPLLGQLALAARGHYQNEAAESRGLVEPGGDQ